MRNVIFSIAIAICAMIATSCTSESVINVDENVQNVSTVDSAALMENSVAFMDLQYNIQKYNAQRFGSEAQHTRGWFSNLFKKIKQVFAVVVSDAVGACFGLKYGGVAGAFYGGTIASGFSATMICIQNKL